MIPVSRTDAHGGDMLLVFLQCVHGLLGLVARPLQEHEHVIHAGRKIAVDEPYDVGGCVSYGADGADERLFPLDAVLSQPDSRCSTRALFVEQCPSSADHVAQCIRRADGPALSGASAHGCRPVDPWHVGLSDRPMDPDPNTPSSARLRTRGDYSRVHGSRASTSLRSPITPLTPDPCRRTRRDQPGSRSPWRAAA